VFGGQDITNGSSRCTANVSVQTATHTYVVTAGHCWLSANDVASQNTGDAAHLLNYDNNKYIGDPIRDPVQAGAVVKCDCEIIGPLTPQSRGTQGYIAKNDSIVTLNSYASHDHDYEPGRLICEDGVSTWLEYSGIVCHRIANRDAREIICLEHNAQGHCTQTYTLEQAITWSMNGTGLLNVQPGDSGAPLYTTSSAGPDYPMLEGVASCGQSTANSVFACFSKARNITDPYPDVTWQGMGPG
jgi:hypothetical protein